MDRLSGAWRQLEFRGSVQDAILVKRDLRYLVTNRAWLLLGTTLAWILCIALHRSVSAHYFQYIGDDRIRALISRYVSGDDRLARRAQESFNASLEPMVLTRSGHPSRDTQIIPPFSLIYILSLHDFYMLSEYTAFLVGMLPGTRFILDWFLQRIDPATGLLGPLPYWNHVDGGVA